MSSPRLEALLRQRALLSQHLAWLDAEISAASGGEPLATGLAATPDLIGAPAVVPPIAPAPAPGSAASAADSAESATSPLSIGVASPSVQPGIISPSTAGLPAAEVVAQANSRADEIIAQYSATDRFDPASTKRGCILLTVALFCLGVTAIMVIYLVGYR